MMALDVKNSFGSRAARATGAAALALGLTFGSMAASAQEAKPVPVAAASVIAAPVELVENSGIAASVYARENPGIAVSVFLGTAKSTPDPSVIQEILTSDFRKAGVTDPITFFFDQNDTLGTGVAYHFSGYVDGPFSLGQSRDEVPKTAETYNFRKEKGLLASLRYDRQ